MKKLSPRQLEAKRVVAEGAFVPAFVKEEDGWYARWQGVGVDNVWIDEYVRQAVITPLTEDAEHHKHETLHDAWMAALKSRTGMVIWDEAECEEFARDLKIWAENAESDIATRKALTFVFAPPDRITVEIPKARASLKALGQATFVYGKLRELRRIDGRLEVKLSQSEAEAFLKCGAVELAQTGFSVEGVNLRAEITAAGEVVAPEVKGKTSQVKLVVKVDGEAVSAAEVKFLLEQGGSLVFFRNRWIEVNRNLLKQALRALEKGIDKKAGLMSFLLGLGHIGDLEIEELKAHGYLRGLLEQLRRSKQLPETSVQGEIDGFVGELRDYQRAGVAWLEFLTENGFGALLADDMGLGKTIQTIAWLVKTQRKDEKTLIVAPLTLIANWQHELKRFAPGLDEGAVTLVNYHQLVKNYERYSAIKWSTLIVDEAQAIKNPDTRISKAVKALSPRRRVALTGTPIENSPADLWSLEEFLNPGFLGDWKSFTERFLNPIEWDEMGPAARKLQHALEPFVLRRLKSAPEIAAELGEKREVRDYIELDSEARAQYEAAIATFRATAHSQGDVFALLTELKLICDGEAKQERLLEKLENIFENGESALVFSQYTKIGVKLREAIARRFSRYVPYLHGALSARERELEIRRFESAKRPTAFVLSLKAGGFGLNLTKATHVIHFDRWWNPAVENQATDRAHRIGQQRTVLVHLLISAGTVEEHVDEILTRKENLKALLKDGDEFWKAVELK